MRASDIFSQLFVFFLPPAIIGTVCLYLYPVLFNCSFPPAQRAVAGCSVPGQQRDGVPARPAPFRLLALADPQLEGDTSLPGSSGSAFPSLTNLWMNVWHRDAGIAELPSYLGAAGKEFVTEDLYYIFQGYRKRLDLWGNDLYLAHVYRSVFWWSNPTHTVVLGDLLGSQHIGDEEFRRRSERFWKSVFKGSEKVPRTVMDASGRTEVLGSDEKWKRRLIAVAGNHDIGYPGDITEHRIQRFEDTFGSVNWAVRFTLNNGTSSPYAWPSGFGATPLAPASPELRLVVLNSMNLDSPAKNSELQDQSRHFASQELHESPGVSSPLTATILLTHIPFHKEEGVCADGPFFDWFTSPEVPSIKAQNHLSYTTSKHLLNGLAKSGKAIVLNGHDHEGCHVYHYRSDSPEDAGAAESEWQAKPLAFAYPEVMNESLTGVREITVRSMMGSFGGNAGFLSGWYDEDTQEWRFEYNNCSLGVQHIWWGVHIFDLVVLGLGVAAVLAGLREESQNATRAAVKQANIKPKRE